MSSPFSDLIQVLALRAQQQPQQEAYRFLDEGGSDQGLTYGALARRVWAIARELRTRTAPGDRVVLLAPPGLRYVEGFLACLCAGRVAVPAYPPDPARLDRTLPRLTEIIADAGATTAVTTAEIGSAAQTIATLVPTLAELAWIDLDSVEILEDGADAPAAPLAADALAFLQYTSGSTGTPRGVMITHGNLMHNLRCIAHAFAMTTESRGVIWLPPYHDMGLIGGLLAPLYVGFPTALMSPLAFLRRPLSWLQAISSYRATISGGPNFSYDLCVRKTSEAERATLDLRSWRLAFSGAEPVRPDTFARFERAFAPSGFSGAAFYPCYGLAEATLMVSGGTAAAGATVRAVSRAALAHGRATPLAADDPGATALVSCGRSLPEMTVRIVRPQERTVCNEGEVGEIWVSGPSVARGYWGKHDDTREAFAARLAPLACAEAPADHFLRTGDIGFLLDGELHICGRSKELIIVRGKNHYPTDLEQALVGAHPGLRPGGGAVYAVEDEEGEAVAVAHEVDGVMDAAGFEEVMAALQSALVAAHGIAAKEITLLPPRALPKTSSGKLQRSAMHRALSDGTLPVLAHHRFTTPETQLDPAAPPAPLDLRQSIAAVLKVSSQLLDPTRPLRSFGLDSLAAVEITSLLKLRHGVTVPVERFFEGLSLDDLSDLLHAAPHAKAPAVRHPVPAAPLQASGTTLPRVRTHAVAASDRRPLSPSAGAPASPSFSLFFFAQDDAEHSDGKYDLVLKAARYADEVGFEAVWTPERHFHPFGGVYPSPAVLGAALAMTTQHLRIRAGSVVLPLQHPVRVAEAWSVVDHLSRGRVDLAFASGWSAQDFALNPGGWPDRHQELFRGVDQVQRLWRGEPLTLPDGEGNPCELRVYPRPVQAELPVWITAAASAKTFERAGAMGARVLTNLLLQSVDELADKIAVYRRSLAAHGHPPERGGITLMLHTFVGDSDEQVRSLVREPFLRYLKSSVDLWSRASARLDAAAKADPDTLLEFAFERYYRTSALFGTPHQCAEFVERLRLIGVSEIACLIDFGVATDEVLAGLAAIARTRDLVRDHAQTVARCYDGLAHITDHAAAVEAYLTFAPFANEVPGFSWVRTLHHPESTPEYAAAVLTAQRELRAVLFRDVKFESLRRVMDIGCGYGADLEALATAHPHLFLVGNTLSAAQAEIAETRLRARDLGDRVRIRCQDSATAPPDDPYDLVLGFEVAVYVRDKARLFAAISAQLRPGATLLLAEFVAVGGAAIHHDATSSHVATLDEWAWLLAAQGLAIRSAVDASSEIANFLADPDFDRSLADLLRDAGGDPALVLHLGSWNNMGLLLRRGVVRYLLLNVGRVERVDATLAEENRTGLIASEPYAQARARCLSAPCVSEQVRTFTIARLDAAARDAAVACMAAVYPRDNRIARALGFTLEDYRPTAERMVDAALAADTGLIVRAAPDAVVGFHFSIDLRDQLVAVDGLGQHADERMRVWGDLLRRLFGAYADVFGRPAHRGEVLYLNVMALDGPARGSGLMPLLQRRAALEFGVQRGYRAIVGIATHPQTRALARGISPDWSAEVAYADLPDARLRALQGTAQIVRFELSPTTAGRAMSGASRLLD